MEFMYNPAAVGVMAVLGILYFIAVIKAAGDLWLNVSVTKIDIIKFSNFVGWSTNLAWFLIFLYHVYGR